MNEIQDNKLAMEHLLNGDLLKAQTMFYKNSKKNESLQTINNLGVFLYYEDKITPSGKTRSAKAIAKQYLKKACSLIEDFRVLYNIGTVEFNEHNFDGARLNFEKAILKTKSDFDRFHIMYDLAVTFYMLGEYAQAERITSLVIDACKDNEKFLSSCTADLIQSNLHNEWVSKVCELYLYSFVKCNYDPDTVHSDFFILKNAPLAAWMLTWYKAGMYDRVLSVTDEYFNNEIEYKSKELDYVIIDSNSKSLTNKDLSVMFGNGEYGVKSSYSKQEIFQTNWYQPQLQMLVCGYYGCEYHKTVYNI